MVDRTLDGLTVGSAFGGLTGLGDRPLLSPSDSRMHFANWRRWFPPSDEAIERTLDRIVSDHPNGCALDRESYRVVFDYVRRTRDGLVLHFGKPIFWRSACITLADLDMRLEGDE